MRRNTMEEKICVIKEKFEKTAIENWNDLIEIYRTDTRAGVQKEIEKARKKIDC